MACTHRLRLRSALDPMSSAMRRSMVGAGPSIRLLLSVAAKDASSCAGGEGVAPGFMAAGWRLGSKRCLCAEPSCGAVGLITRHLHGAPVAAYLASPAGVWSEHRSGLQSLLQGGFAVRAYAAAAGGEAGKQASKEARQEVGGLPAATAACTSVLNSPGRAPWPCILACRPSLQLRRSSARSPTRSRSARSPLWRAPRTPWSSWQP